VTEMLVTISVDHRVYDGDAGGIVLVFSFMLIVSPNYFVLLIND
jgi:hypothetical protein